MKGAEHHHFQSQGRWYLFDTNAFTVLRSEPLDSVILEAAGRHLSADALVEHAVSQGASPQHARERVKLLAENRYLLPETESAELAVLRETHAQVTFMINVAQQCNLSCPYCYVNWGRFDYEREPISGMALATAGRLVDQVHTHFPGFPGYAYHFYGGEPLLNFRAIRQVVARAKEKAAQTHTQARFQITTNGTLLDRETADFMDENAFSVIVSLDGDRERHDRLRKYPDGNGSYDDIANNIAYLRTKRRIRLALSAVISDELPLGEALRLLNRCGAHSIKAEHVRLPAGHPLSLTQEGMAAHLADLRETLIDHYIAALCSDRQPKDRRLYSKILGLLTRTRRTFFCTAGERIFGIAANGEIYPCALHVGRPQSRLGHIDTGLDPERRSEFRDKFSWRSQQRCQTCWTRHLCGGGCSAMVDRFGQDDCSVLRAETEAAIVVYQQMAESDPTALYGLLSPELVSFIRGERA